MRSWCVHTFFLSPQLLDPGRYPAVQPLLGYGRSGYSHRYIQKAVFSCQVETQGTSPHFLFPTRKWFRVLHTIMWLNLCCLKCILLLCLSLISPEQSTKVKNYIIDILSSLVKNGESLPQEVMDIVFSNILRQEPEVDGTKTSRGAAYAFTVEFIRRTSSHIEPYIHLVSGCIPTP